MLAVALIGSLAVVLVANPLATPQPTQGVPPPTPSVTEQPAPPPPAGITYRDFAFDQAVQRTPTASKMQSRLWFAEGSWWAAMLQPTANRLAIFRLDPTSQVWTDTGVLVDERPFAYADVLWDGTHLYVVSGGQRPSPSHALRFVRFSYDDVTAGFTLDRNFPVPLSAAGTNGATIARDGTGTLWVSYVLGGQVLVAHTLADDALWTAPSPLRFREASVGPEDVAAIIAFGPDRIGLMWTNEVISREYFSVHEDGAPDDAWSEPEIVIEAGTTSDNHLNLKTYPLGDGTGVAAALKTSADDEDPVNQLDPLILLAVRDDAGVWTTHQVAQVRDHHTRPIVLVDAGARMLYVALTSPGRGGAIFYKRTSLDRIAFDTGEGVPLILSAADVRINDATAGKDPLTTGSGLVVLASDQDTGRFLHGVVDLGGGPPTVDPADPARPTIPNPPVSQEAMTFVHDDFEPFPAGPADGTMWARRAGDPPTAFTIAGDGADGRALRVKATVAAGVRACRSFPAVEGAKLLIRLRVRVSAFGKGDTPLLSVRGSGGESASVRFTDRRVFAWFDRTTKIRSTIAFRPKTWYRIAATIDQVKRTYAFSITTDAGRTVVKRSGLRWRMAAVRSVGAICIETARSTPGQIIDLAEVHVLKGPGS